MSVEYSTDLYYGCRIDDYYDKITDIIDSIPESPTKERLEYFFDDYIFHLNAWSSEGIFLGYRVMFSCDEVVKLSDYCEAKNEDEKHPDANFLTFINFLKEKIPDLPPFDYCLVSMIY